MALCSMNNVSFLQYRVISCVESLVNSDTITVKQVNDVLFYSCFVIAHLCKAVMSHSVKGKY